MISFMNSFITIKPLPKVGLGSLSAESTIHATTSRMPCRLSGVSLTGIGGTTTDSHKGNPGTDCCLQ